MSGGLLSFLLRPPEPAPDRSEAPVTSAPDRVVVLARPEHALGAAAAVVAAEVQLSGSAVALVCCWGQGVRLPSRLIPGGRAAGAAGALRRAGLEASVAGRAAWVTLPLDPTSCGETIALACARADPGPLVLVLAGVRPVELDELVRGADAVVVACGAGEDPLVAELVIERILDPQQRGGVLNVHSRRFERHLSWFPPRGLVDDALRVLRADHVSNGAGAERASRHALA